MTKDTMTVQITDVFSSQEWTSDPDMIAVTLDAAFLNQAAKCVAFMKTNDVSTMTIWWAFNYECYALEEEDREFIIGDDGKKYSVFTPEYRLEGCSAKMFKDGLIRAVLPLKDSAHELWGDIGMLDDIQAKQARTIAAANLSDAARICQRLLDPLEYRAEVHDVPTVAADAVHVIERLTTGVAATQTALSQAMQYAEKADQFVAQTTALTIWGHDRNDGTPYEECEEPAEGYVDSHSCLMNLIEAARDVLQQDTIRYNDYSNGLSDVKPTARRVLARAGELRRSDNGGTDMAISAQKVKALTGAQTKMAGLNTLYRQIEQKKWHRWGRGYTAAGYDHRKDLVHFTATWAAEGGGIGHSRVAVSMTAALSSKDGDLKDALVLH